MPNFFLCRGTFLKSTLGQHKVILYVLNWVQSSSSWPQPRSLRPLRPLQQDTGCQEIDFEKRKENLSSCRHFSFPPSPLLHSTYRKVDPQEKREGMELGRTDRKSFPPSVRQIRRRGVGWKRKYPHFRPRLTFSCPTPTSPLSPFLVQL